MAGTIFRGFLSNAKIVKISTPPKLVQYNSSMDWINNTYFKLNL